jgi:prolipoprotein diacylglyceryltransferase
MNKWYGILFILAGLGLIIWTIKFPEKKGDDPMALNFKGFFWGILSIVIGLLILFKE